MKLEHVRAFYWSATLESESAAAKRLQVSQPTISTHLKQLEQELGVRLFAREPFRLSETGRRVLPTLTKLWQLEQQLRAELAPAPQRLVRFRLGVVEAVQHAWLGALAAHLRANEPNLQLEMSVNTSAELAKQVAQGALDLVVSTLPVSGKRVQTCSAGTMAMVFVGDRTLHKRRHYAFEQLAELGLIGFQPDSQPYRHLTKLLEDSGREAVVHAVSSVSGMVALLSAGFGVATLPREVVERLKQPNLRILACDAALPQLPIHISHRVDPGELRHAELARRVIAFVRAAAKS